MKFIILITMCSISSIVECTTINPDTLTPPTNNYTVTTQQGVACVVFSAGLQVRVPYISVSKNETLKVNLRTPKAWNGTCGKDDNILNVYFDNAWSVSFTFSNSSAKSYSMKSITLTYVPTEASIPTVPAAGSGVPKTQTTVLPEATDAGPHSGSFKCSGETTLILTNGLSLHLYDLQYRAFGKTNSTSFSSSNVQSCLNSTQVPDTNTAVALAVGIALGAMIVVVVALYLIISKASGL